MEDRSDQEGRRRYEADRLSDDIRELKSALRVKSDKDDIAQLKEEIKRLERLIEKCVTMDRFRATEVLSWSSVAAISGAVLSWIVAWVSNGRA